MGSFNTTCFVTGQTIAPGDRAYIFPIQQSSGYNPVEFEENEYGVKSAMQPYHTTCYSNAFWKPIGGMISCEYYDYGQFKVDDTKLNKGYIATFLSTPFLVTKQGENPCHDLPFDPEKMDLTDPIAALEAVWDVMVHEGRVFTLDYNQQASQVGFAVVCAPAFDLAVEKYGKFKDWNENKLDVHTQMTMLMGYLETAWKFKEDAKDIDKDDKDAVSEQWMVAWDATDSIRRMFERGESYRFLHYDVMNSITHKGRPDEEKMKNVKLFCESCIKEKNFFGFLEHINVKVQPIIYTSQDYDNDIGEQYAKFVNAVQKKVSKVRKDRYDD